MTSDRDQAIFEAGIELGALYHQWVGTPISPQTAEVIEEAIEQAVGLQPFVEEITVRLDTRRMRPNEFGYSGTRRADVRGRDRDPVQRRLLSRPARAPRRLPPDGDPLEP